MEKLKVCCENCKHGMLLSDTCEIYEEKRQKFGFKLYDEMIEFEKEDKSEFGCSYDCRYIEYPLKITNGISVEDFDYSNKKISKLVKVKYCKDKKTYLGLYLGELPTQISVSHIKDKSTLEIMPSMCNPAILVPKLGKIIFGYESFWSFIKTEDDFEDITEDEIENVWYVQALKAISND